MEFDHLSTTPYVRSVRTNIFDENSTPSLAGKVVEPSILARGYWHLVQQVVELCCTQGL